MTARLGTVEATTTGVIGDGDLGVCGRVKRRDRAARSTNEGERTRAMKVESAWTAIWRTIVSIVGSGEEAAQSVSSNVEQEDGTRVSLIQDL